MWAVGLALGLLPLVIWVLRSFNEWRFCYPYLQSKNGKKLPPGHMGWPMIGELLDFLWCFKYTKNPDDFIWKRRTKYGDTGVYRTYLFGSPTIITCSPEANRFMTGGEIEGGSLTTGWPSPQLMGTSSIAMVEGMQHKRIRRYIMEALNSPQSLKGMFAPLQPSYKAALESWADKGTITAAEESNEMTFSNMCALLFSFHSAPMLKKMQRFYRGLLGGLRAQPINLPGTAFHYAVKCRKKLSAIILSEIHDRNMNKANIKEDFMQHLIDSVDSNGDKLSEEEILDNMVSLVLGGYASTANSITWALYYLAKYPTVLQKLREENISIRDKKGEEKLLTYEDVKSMTYTSKVINEIIRLANVASSMFRTVLRDVDFNGFIFPKNWKVLIWLRSNHVDPQYFENPLEFNPERWDEPQLKLGVYYPFGSGYRMCPGNNFARMELFMFLHQVCIDYKWELENSNAGTKFLPHTMVADGAKVRFTRIYK